MWQRKLYCVIKKCGNAGGGVLCGNSGFSVMLVVKGAVIQAEVW